MRSKCSYHNCSIVLTVENSQGFSRFMDGTVLMVTTGRDGQTVVKMEPWSRPVDNFTQLLTRAVPSRRPNISHCTVPSCPIEEISPYRPVPSTQPAHTVSSRRQNLPKPSCPAVKNCPYRQISPSKPVPTVSPRHSLPSLVKMP